MTARGRVLATPAASPAAARAHFEARLAFETDPSDVHADLDAGAKAGFVVVDTRSEEAFQKAHVPGAIHLTPAMMDEAVCDHFLGAPGDKVVVAYCWGPYCNSGDKGAAKLAALGYSVKLMIGGIDAWRHEGYAIEGLEAEAA